MIVVALPNGYEIILVVTLENADYIYMVKSSYSTV